MKLAGAFLALFLAIAGLPAHGQEEVVPPAAGSPNPLSSLAIESFPSTLSQPLFTPSRTPPVVEEPYVEPEIVEVAPPPPPEPPPEPPPFRLVGIVMGESEQLAIMTDESTGEVHNFASGEDYDGWTMEIVDARTVEFQNADMSHTLTMFEEFEAPPEMAGYDSGYYDQQYRPQSERRAYDSPLGAESDGVIDPNTGFPIDPNTGMPTDPSSGLAYDPSTGYPIDPNTGLPTDPESGIAYDPNTGYPIDPSTGEPYDPNTGFPIDPNTGEAYDPDTGQPIDPNTGQPIDTGSIP